MDLHIIFSQKQLILILSWSFCQMSPTPALSFWVTVSASGGYMPLFLLFFSTPRPPSWPSANGGGLPMVLFYWMYESCFSLIGYEWLAHEVLSICWEYHRHLLNIQKCKSYGCSGSMFFLRIIYRKSLAAQGMPSPTKTLNEIKWSYHHGIVFRYVPL